VESLRQFSEATKLVPEHPLAALGRCQALLAVGDIDAAVLALERVRQDQPNLAGAHAVTALALAMLGRTSEALATIDGALATFPDDPWLLDTRVRLLVANGDDAEALSAVDRALEVDPTDRTWRGLRAEIQLSMGVDTDDAITTFRDLAMSQPDSLVAVERLTNALELTDRHEEALAVIERALLERPEEPMLLAAQVRLLSQVGRHRDAVRLASAATGRGMSRARVALPLAESLLALGEYQGALSATGDADPDDAGSPGLRRARGLALHHLGRHEEAVEDLAAALAAADTDAANSGGEVAVALSGSLSSLADDKAGSGDRAGARPLLERAIEVDPANAHARTLMAELLRREGDFVGALEQADLGLDLDPDNAWLLGTRGQILEALGQDDRAEADLRRTLDIDGSLVWARVELGDLLRVKRKLTEAITHLSLAIKAQPDDPWPLASKGAAEYALDHYDEALHLLNRSLELADDYAWAHGVIAAVLADVDDLAGARDHCRRGLELDPSMGWAWTHLGWVLVLLADESEDADLLAQAVDAHTRGNDRQERSLASLSGLAEALAVTGDLERATELFTEALKAAGHDGVKLDADGLARVGWCHLRIGQGQQAIDSLVRAISLDTTHVEAAFDLALALLCDERTDVALEEYSQAMARVRGVRHPGRQRFLVRVARRDLRAVASPQLAGRAEVEQLLMSPGGK
jgi:tetratricopeptide (TPR) repeat protein